VSPSSGAAQSITGGGRGRGAWSNGQVVSPKPELDTGRAGEGSRQRTRDGMAVRESSSDSAQCFPSHRHTCTIYHCLYVGSENLRRKKKHKEADCVMLLCFFGIRFPSFNPCCFSEVSSSIIVANFYFDNDTDVALCHACSQEPGSQ